MCGLRCRGPVAGHRPGGRDAQGTHISRTAAPAVLLKMSPFPRVRASFHLIVCRVFSPCRLPDCSQCVRLTLWRVDVLCRFPRMIEWGDAVSSPGPRQPLTPRRPLSRPWAPPHQPHGGGAGGRAGGASSPGTVPACCPRSRRLLAWLPCVYLASLSLPSFPDVSLARMPGWGDGPQHLPGPSLPRTPCGVPGNFPKPCAELREPGTERSEARALRQLGHFKPQEPKPTAAGVPSCAPPHPAPRPAGQSRPGTSGTSCRDWASERGFGGGGWFASIFNLESCAHW